MRTLMLETTKGSSAMSDQSDHNRTKSTKGGIMHSVLISRVGAAALLVLSLFATVPAVAKDGRDFAGFYSLTDINEKADQVQVTLTLQLFNYSGVDLNQVVIHVRQSSPEAAALATFAPIQHWRNGQDVVVSQAFTVGRVEFEQWSTHGQPNIFVLHSDEDGQTLRQSVQLTQRPQVP